MGGGSPKHKQLALLLFLITFFSCEGRFVLNLTRVNHTLSVVTNDIISASERFSLLQYFVELDVKAQIQRPKQPLKLGLDSTSEKSSLFLSKLKASKLSQNKTLKTDLTLTADFTLPNYEFTLETRSAHEGIYQGTLGLGLGKRGSNSTNFLSLLLFNNIIDSGIFAFNYAAGTSSVVFGGYDGKLVDEFKYYSVKDSWSLDLGECKFNKKSVDCQGAKQVEFDTSVYGIVLPKKLAQAFLTQFKPLLRSPDDCVFIPNLYLKCECSQLFWSMIESISFAIGDAEYKIFVKDLFLREEFTSKDKINGVCYYAITYSSKRAADRKIVVGQNFLEKYYVLFDFEKRRIGISNLINGQSAKQKSDPFTEDVMLSLGIIGFLIITVSLFYFMFNLLRSENMKRASFAKVSTAETT